MERGITDVMGKELAGQKYHRYPKECALHHDGRPHPFQRRVLLFEKYNLLSGQSLSPSFLFKIQDEYSQLDLGLYWYQMPLVIGIWYRGIPLFKELKSNDALAFLIGFKMDQISIGYSYDLTISQLVGFTGGAHEISVNYQFNQGVTARERRKGLPCPTF